MTEPKQQLEVFSNTTDEAALAGLKEGMLAALALQNLPELGESQALDSVGSADVAEQLGISSILFKNGADSIVISADGSKPEQAAAKIDTTPKFDG